MKRLLIITLICLLFSSTNSFQFEDDYSNEDEDSSDEKAPVYELKDAPKLFEKFIKDYHKDYKSKEDRDMHYKNFVSNLKYINEVNRESRSFKVDINLFADLAEDEFSVFE
ncbi:unnamed protein product [Euphydryas editha]|uniref:Cathepsin propeptide inhibitor domain-containing protein n=1 Tax=Euphydryas editha TaxID=104508 RepID=A0AAU9V819_EUPED|nr:unnamed protein product [Euphydryas editha]